MTITKAIRWLLAWAAALVVAWSFFEVGLRLWREHDPRDHRTPLVILQWGDASEERIVTDLVAQYESEHPDTKIMRIHAGADFNSKLNTMLAAGTPPDLFYMSYENVPAFAQLHLLADLDPYIAKLPDGQRWLDGFYPVLLDAFRYDGQMTGRGPLFGIPKDFTPMMMYVNCDLFEKAGIAIPYGGWTWDEFEADCKKISALPPDVSGRFYGATLNTWPGVLQNMLQCYGGDFFNGADFRDMTIDSPGSVAALSMIQRTRFIDKSVYQATGPMASDNGVQLFYTGKVAAIGPVGRWETPHFRGTGPGDPGITEFHWDVVPLPHETRTVSDIAVVAWSMSSATKHPEQAFDLLHFLTGPEGQAIMARLGMAIPSLKSVAHSDAFLIGKPQHSQLFLDEIEHAQISQIPAQPEFSQYVTDELGACLELNQVSPAEAAKNLKERWHREMQSPLRRTDFPPMNWRLVGGAALGAVLAAVAVVWAVSRRQKLGHLDLKMERTGWLFISPWVIGFLFLTLGPMVLSLLLSLTQWTAMAPMTEARFVGMSNYRQLVAYDPDTGPSLRVTAYYAMLAVPLGQIAALAVAMLMNTNVRGIGLFRTIYYLPTLVGGVTMAAIWEWLLNKDYGLINRLLAPLAHLLGTTPPDWLNHDAARWAIPAFVLMSLWTVGGGMLTYLAALKNVPVSLYEAARIDGASTLRQFFTVTVPMISPLIFFNLIMAIIGSFQIFAQVYVMTGGGPGTATLVYVLYLYRQAFVFHNMGYASAMAWVLFILILLLTGIVIRGSRRWVYYEGLKA
jgi:multiple sugar transport system permease protein